ncbi:MAG: hypothetical protein U1F66_06865 [bacterium]
MNLHRIKSLLPLVLACLVAGMSLGCAGLTGLGGGQNLAQGENASEKDGSKPEGGNNPGAAASFRPGDEGQPTGLRQVTGPDPGAAGGSPGFTSQAAGNPAAYTAANPLASGYRPGNEGQVQKGRKRLVHVSISGLDGRSNCGKPEGSPLEAIFSTDGTPTLQWWLGDDDNGEYLPKGFFSLTSEYGRIAISCQDDDPDLTPYRYALLLAVFTDAQGKVHRSEPLRITCPDLEKSQAQEFCLSLNPPMQFHRFQPNAETVLRHSGGEATILKKNPDND